MKTRRQCKILELIQEHCIETQDELLTLLRDNGFTVTQATVSRDIKELRLVKALGSNGRYRYVSSQPETPDISAKFYSLFSDSVASIEQGGNIVCIKCFVGMAQAVCASMDSIRWDGVVGTLAGEDTIFVLCVTEASATALKLELKQLISA
ncbi:MAG: arginine repressor [Clostridia bacterium]|nr:arginine repressor [Clostridia bacterium]